LNSAALSNYIPVALILVVAVAMGIGMVLSGRLVGPQKPTRVKQETYECGIETIGPARIRFPIKFGLVALLFLAFDLEGIFLFLWAIAYHPSNGVVFADGGLSFQMFAFLEMSIFLAILLVGYVYVWRKGALDW
jgi:NADH-quinone oxidoreductase subunit A